MKNMTKRHRGGNGDFSPGGRIPDDIADGGVGFIAVFYRWYVVRGPIGKL